LEKNFIAICLPITFDWPDGTVSGMMMKGATLPTHKMHSLTNYKKQDNNLTEEHRRRTMVETIEQFQL
jgi:hypothetical protein